MAKKTLAEKFSEAVNRPVPDETLTVAWWDFDAESDDEKRSPKASDDNPQHKGDFIRLLNAAAKRREQED
jgi:hypothetical protein